MGFFSNLFGRFGRVARGQFNKGMDKVEDATFEATIRQTIRDMKTELNDVVRSSAEAMSNHNRLEAEYQKNVRQAQEWRERAKKALEMGNEDLARRALAKKSQCDEQVEAMQNSVEAARSASDKLKAQVSALKGRISEAERNASTLIARKNAAKAQKRVAEALAGVGETENAFAALKNFEETVAREEATALAYESMASHPDADLEAEFEALDVSDTDRELADLKKELGQ
jgi:phage shock protein A